MLSVPLLTGMLREEGHEAETFDVNSLFMNFIISEEFISYVDFKMKKYSEILKTLNPQKDIDSIKYINEIRYFLSQNSNFFVGFFKKFKNANEQLKTLLDKPIDEFNDFYNSIKTIVNGGFKTFYRKPENVPDEYLFFYEWDLENLIKNIKDLNPDLIGFSVYSYDQFEWSLNLSKKIKKYMSAKIVFGGTQITDYRNAIKQIPDIFENCVDAFIYGEGEIAFKKIANNEQFQTIPNIIFKDSDGIIKINQVDKSNQKFYKPDYKQNADEDFVVNNLKTDGNLQSSKFYKPDYTGINLSKFFVPKTVLPIETSRGCYWHKCEFCTFMDCISYKQKNVDDMIEELKEYVYKMNVNHFFVSDAAMHPEYAKEFARKIIENNLKIYYLTDLRLEKEFDYNLLKLMYDSGLRIILWGLESGSDRILKLYNKGTTVENNSRVIKTASEVGIFNWCWTMILFPQETVEEMYMTKQFLVDHYKYIDYISLHNYTYLPTSPIAQHPDDFGLTEYLVKISEKDNSLAFKAPQGLFAEAEKIRREIFKIYEPKMSLYPDDLSCQLLRRAKERP